MEISRIGQAPQAMRQTEKQGESRRTSSFSTSRMDKLELSAAVVDALRAKEKEKAKSKGLIALMRPQQQKDPQIEAMKKQMKTLRQCAKIAASLREGDNVPPEDLRFLLRNNPHLYTLAMAMRKPKEDPEDCKSVLEKEEEESSAQKVQESEGSPDVSGSGGTQSSASSAPAAPSAPAGGGGGDVSSGSGSGGTGGGFGGAM